MTSIPTAPVSRPATAPQPVEPPPAAPHEHGWRMQSAHRTSEGRVLYVRCHCGARRVDLQGADATPPTALSHPIDG